MKTQFKSTFLLMITLIVFGCSKNDDNSNTNPIVGQWEYVSGDFILGDDKYLYFNADNTLNILSETNANFRGAFNTNYAVSNDEITFAGIVNGLDLTANYTIDNNILIIFNDFFNMTLQKLNNGPNVNQWIESLTILSEGMAPWDGLVDIAFTYDKTKIVYGKTNDSDHIGLIDPITFEEVGQIATTNSARTVEIEKFDSDFRYLFQSDNDSDVFYGYNQDTNNLEVTSNPLGAWIKGLASVDNNNIWVASGDESSLYLYNYVDNAINTTIVLDLQPEGLDYQNGILYICDGRSFHKCQISPNFQVLKTYAIPNVTVNGIAFDGANFWVSGYNYVNQEYKLIKTSLTL